VRASETYRPHRRNAWRHTNRHRPPGTKRRAWGGIAATASAVRRERSRYTGAVLRAIRGGLEKGLELLAKMPRMSEAKRVEAEEARARARAAAELAEQEAKAREGADGES
jgi:hypothetical protein